MDFSKCLSTLTSMEAFEAGGEAHFYLELSVKNILKLFTFFIFKIGSFALPSRLCVGFKHFSLETNNLF